MNKLITVTGTTALMVAMAGCGSSTPSKPAAPAEPKTFDVSGTFVLSDSGSILDGTSDGIGCFGTGGYEDISGGLQVIIKDADGKQIAIGSLGLGVPHGGEVGYEPDDCSFDITVKDVPVQKGSDIYSIEVGHRGSSSFNQDQADDISLSLGD